MTAVADCLLPDRRANNVGDIITITLEESMSAANSGSETLSKSDSYVFDLPVTSSFLFQVH